MDYCVCTTNHQIWQPMRYYFTRIALTILTLIYSSLNVLAAPEDHGRDYSIDGGSSSHSPALYIIVGIILFVVSLMLLPVDDDGHEKDGSANTSNNKGCAYMGMIIAIGIFILGISQCSS